MYMCVCVYVRVYGGVDTAALSVRPALYHGAPSSRAAVGGETHVSRARARVRRGVFVCVGRTGRI